MKVPPFKASGTTAMHVVHVFRACAVDGPSRTAHEASVPANAMANTGTVAAAAAASPARPNG